jgi:CheY-like chemotaxis protein
MSEKVLKHCFEPFYTTRELGRGTGLGLATVYGIVKQNQAAITIASQLGIGTKVRIFWPLLDQPGDTDSCGEVFEESYLHIRTGNLTVLLVEDEVKILRLAERYLLQAGFRVLSFPHGRAAVEYLEGMNETPDILFTDIVMPEMSGEDLAAMLKDRYPGIMIIYTTGYNDGIARQLDENEVFLRKPYTKRVLMMALEELLVKRKSSRSDEV